MRLLQQTSQNSVTCMNLFTPLERAAIRNLMSSHLPTSTKLTMDVNFIINNCLISKDNCFVYDTQTISSDDSNVFLEIKCLFYLLSKYMC